MKEVDFILPSTIEPASDNPKQIIRSSKENERIMAHNFIRQFRNLEKGGYNVEGYKDQMEELLEDYGEPRKSKEGLFGNNLPPLTKSGSNKGLGEIPEFDANGERIR